MTNAARKTIINMDRNEAVILVMKKIVYHKLNKYQADEWQF